MIGSQMDIVNILMDFNLAVRYKSPYIYTYMGVGNLSKFEYGICERRLPI